MRRERSFAFFIGLKLGGIDKEPRSIWAHEMEKLWFKRMLNEREKLWFTRMLNENLISTGKMTSE